MTKSTGHGKHVPRDANGHWKKGASPNPSGRKKGLEARIRELVDFDAIAHTLQDIVLGDRTTKRGKPGRKKPSAKDADRVLAARLLFDRGFGLAKAIVEVDLGRLAELSDGELEKMLIDEVMGTIANDQLRAIVQARFGERTAQKLLDPIDATAVETKPITPAAAAEPVRSHTEEPER